MYLKKALMDLLVLIGIFLSPIETSLLMIGLLVSVDTVFKLISLNKTGEVYDGKMLMNFLYKTIVYMLSLVVVRAIQMYFSVDLELIKIITTFICIKELKSMDKTTEKLTGMSIFKYIINLLSKSLKTH